jgi:membrane-associated phospholipid phosphatase
MSLTKWERFVLYPLCGILLILFAFYDLPIMQSLYNPTNFFGRAGELFGEVPTQLFGVVCGFWLFRFRDKSTKARNVIFAIVGLVVAVFFAGYGGGQIYSYLHSPIASYSFHPGIWIAFPVAAAYLLVGGLLGYLIKISKPREAVVLAYFFVIFYLLTLLVMNGLKFFWARPRWRFLVNEYGEAAKAYFQPWYCWGFRWKFSDSYASFPSGHTMNALMWICLAGCSSFIDKLKGKEWIVRLIVYVWAILVAISRTIMGAHFPSDTTAGFVVELLCFDLLGHYFYPWFRAKLLPAESASASPKEA